jgi:hypothetical protein
MPAPPSLGWLEATAEANLADVIAAHRTGGGHHTAIRHGEGKR